MISKNKQRKTTDSHVMLDPLQKMIFVEKTFKPKKKIMQLTYFCWGGSRHTHWKNNRGKTETKYLHGIPGPNAESYGHTNRWKFLKPSGNSSLP